MRIDQINYRNNGIDCIRGFCILAVILLHLNIHFNYSESFLKEVISKKIFSLLFWSGYYGVVIFFTVSGFLITSSILRKWDSLSKIDIRTFYWFRFTRIIPLLSILLFVLSILHLTNSTDFVINEEQTSLGRAILSVLTFHINWLEIQVGYLPANWDVLWSISIEEAFYITFPLICLFLKKNWHFIFVLAFFIVLSPWARTSLFIGNELADKNHLAYLDSIAFGCMSAILFFKVKLNTWINRSTLILGTILVILVLYFRGFIYKVGITSLGLNVSILSLGIAFLLIVLHQKKHLKLPILMHWIAGMGKYSYEIYVTHMFIILAGARFYKKYNFNENWLIPFAIALIVISYLLGKYLFKYLSDPLNLWLRKKWLLKNPIPSEK